MSQDRLDELLSTTEAPLRTQKWLYLFLPCLFLGATAADLSSQVVEETSWKTEQGQRVLQQRVLVDAPLNSVWQAYTTPEGLRSFVAPVADITLEVGGLREASYDPGARSGDPGMIVNEILTYLPREMFSLRVKEAPADFPYPDAVKALWTVVQLDETSRGAVWVTVTMLGFGSGHPWDTLYEAFGSGNATELRRLARLFESGPVDWGEIDTGLVRTK